MYPAYNKQHEAAVLNLSQARSEAQEVGKQRRVGIANRARDIRLEAAKSLSETPKPN
jgi:hypothetical protein